MQWGFDVSGSSACEDIAQSTFKELKCPTHPLHYMYTSQGFHVSDNIKADYTPFQLQSVRKQDMVEI